MAKQKTRIEVELGFSTDTDRAKVSMKELHNQLTTILNLPRTSNFGAKMTNDLLKSVDAAAQLKAQLQLATNVNTGKLNLTKFNQQLKQGGITLQQYAQQLSAIGPLGAQAFQNVSRVIQQAEIPLINISGRMEKLLATLGNTLRWQISSSLLMGFTSTIQDAIRYAEDLNQNLNEIRIVTGYSADKMNEFAVAANKAAKELRTTTNDYVKASLIYFQQGLSDEEVKRRTDITVKMANVTRQTAQEVSDQLTAVWNNFYDGTISLEHYADVMTKLGAITASSSEEIAGGLEKFAAIADVIGLSYEYAAAALTTITAQTRQSEDVVGTALKTIFGRLESLSLGEELEDGVTLTKYSQALQTVGVEVVTASGELRKMDDILNDLGSRWDTLSSAQQAALAQTVGGMRQYNQLIALMDNWSVFQENLQAANNASGELQKQQDIYAESWEAARDRVTASIETIYQELLNDDAFIAVTDFFADLIGFVDKTIDSMGGLGGVLTLVSSILMKTFSAKIADGINNTASAIKGLVTGQKELYSLKQQAIDESLQMSNYMGSSETTHGSAMQQSIEYEARRNAEIEDSLKNQSAAIQQKYKILSEVLASQDKEVEKLGQIVDLERESLKATTIIGKSDKFNKGAYKEIAQDLVDLGQKAKVSQKDVTDLKTKLEGLFKNNKKGRRSQEFKELSQAIDKAEQEVLQLEQAQQRYGKAAKNAAKANNQFFKDINNLPAATVPLSQKLVSLAGNLTSVVFAFQSLNSIKDVIDNDELSSWEKFLQVTLSVSMALSSLLPIITSIAKHWKSYTSILGVLTGKKLTDAAATYAQAKAELYLQKIRNNENISEADTDALLEKAGWKKNQKGGWTKPGQGKRGSLNKTDALNSLSPDAINSFAKGKGLESKGVGLQALPSMAKLGIVAAVVVAVAAAFAGLVKWTNKHNDAAKKARERADELANSYKKTKEEFEEFKNLSSSYKEAQKGLKELTRGTVEYTEALINANDQARDLINKYNISDYTINSDGLIEINEDALTNAREQALRQVIAMQTAAQQAELEAGRAQQKADEINALRDVKTAGDGGFWKGAGGAAAGIAIGLVAAGILATIATGGLAAGPMIAAAIAGGVAGGSIMGDGSASKAEKQGLDALQQEYARLKDLGKDAEADNLLKDEKVMKEFLSSTALNIDPKVIEALAENKESIEKLVESNYALIKEQSTQRKQLVLNANVDNDDFQNSMFKDIIVEGAGNLEAGWFKDAVENEKKSLSTKAASSAWDKEISYKQQVSQMYADFISNGRAKWNVEEEGAFRVKGWLDKKLQQYKDGKWTTLDMSPDSMISAMAEQSAAELTDVELDEIYDKFMQDYNKLRTSGLSKDKALAALKARESGDALSLAGFTGDEISILSDAAIMSAEKVQQAKENLQKDWDELSIFVKSIVGDDALLSEFSYDLAEKMGDLEKMAIMQGGQKALDALQAVLDSDQMNEDLINTLSSFTDWGDPQALEKLNQILEDQGISIESLPNAYKEYAQAMQEAAIAAGVFSGALKEIIKNAAKTVEIIEKLGAGSKIDEKTYLDLIETNPLLRNYFIPLADGNYLFTGDSNALVGEINTATGQTIDDSVEQYLEGLNKARAAGLLIEGAEDKFNIEANPAGFQDAWASFMALDPDILENIGINKAGIDKINSSSDTDETKRQQQEKWLKAIQQYILDGRSGKGVADVISSGISFNLTNFKSIDELNKVINDYSALLGENRAKQYQQTFGVEWYRQINNDLFEALFDSAEAQRLDNELMKLEDQLADAGDRQDIEAAEQIKTAINNILQARLNTLVQGFQFASEEEIANMGEDSRKEYYENVGRYYNEVKKLKESAELTKKSFEKIQSAIEDFADELTRKIYDIKLKELNRQIDALGNSAEDAQKKLALLGRQSNLYKEETGRLTNFNFKSDDELSQMFNDGDMEGIKEYSDDLTNHYNDLANHMSNLESSKQMAIQSLTDSFNDYADRFEKLLKQHELLVKKTDSFKTMIKLYRQFEEVDSSIIQNLNRVTTEHSLQAITFYKNQIDALKASKAVLINASSDLIKQIDDQIQQATDNYYASWSTAIEAIKETFMSNVDEIMYSFERKFVGVFGSFDELLKQFDQTSEEQERYLQDYEKAYELSKLNRQINKDLNDTNNVKTRSSLLELQEEINKLQKDETKMTQYDVENLQRKYDLRLAEIALEEAQNAKTSVQLQRDSEGNWGYVYTADQNDISDAEQKVEDAYYNLYQANDAYIKQSQQQLLTAQKEFLNSYKEILLSDDDDEVKTAKLEKLQQQFNKKIQFFSTENDKALGNNQLTAEEEANSFINFSSGKTEAWTGFVTSWDQSILGTLLPGYQNMQQYQQSFNDAIGNIEAPGTLLGDLHQAHQEYFNNLNTILELAGFDWENFGEVVANQTVLTIGLLNLLGSESNELKLTMSSAMEAMSKEVDSYVRDMNKQLQALQREIEDTIAALNRLNSRRSTSTLVPTNPGNNQDALDRAQDAAQKAVDAAEKVYESSKDLTESAKEYAENKKQTNQAIIDAINGYFNSGVSITDPRSSSKAQSLATGGYTGSWGPEGRFAVLHEKELILNKEDTANILTAVNVVRSIAQQLQNQALLQAHSTGLNAAKALTQGQVLQQQVSIVAEFPNATDHREIEEALHNIVNSASQYANNNLYK